MVDALASIPARSREQQVAADFSLQRTTYVASWFLAPGWLDQWEPGWRELRNVALKMVEQASGTGWLG